MTASDILNERLLPNAQRIAGSTLVHVGYRVLKHEATADDIDRPDFYLGGEVKLLFGNADAVYVSWDQNAGWPDDTIFSLLLSSGTSSWEDALDEFSADKTKIWSPHIGNTIQSTTILGIDGVPFVLAIQTAAGRIFLGSSFQNQFGDGDDVFVSTDLESISSMVPIWQSPAGA